MNSINKPVDSLPAEFSSYEEAADFWDTHDTMDYPDVFETVVVQSELRQRHDEVEIEPDIIPVLRKQAQQGGVSISHLVSHLLRQQIISHGWLYGQPT